ncbi:MAG: cytochrome c maturation protein CcmE [Acidobacteria bacterium]|nr:cytochrome c maturation protein CcmE [Acidobacteriota bacterium]
MSSVRSGRKNWRFAAGIAVILTTVAWLAYSGIQESKTYYVTVSELVDSQQLQERRLRVAGDVTAGSILRDDGRVNFQIEQGGKMLKIVYTGSEPLPDTLADGAEAIADGRYQPDGTFHAEAVQAKCPSKYEAVAAQRKASGIAPGEYVPPAGAPTSMSDAVKYNGGYPAGYSGGYSK